MASNESITVDLRCVGHEQLIAQVRGMRRLVKLLNRVIDRHERRPFSKSFNKPAAALRRALSQVEQGS